jgi:hypothetical protein
VRIVSRFPARFVVSAYGQRSIEFFRAGGLRPVIARASWSLARTGGQLNLKRLGLLEIFLLVCLLIFITLTFQHP